jgi:hypothetical protein
VTSIYDAPLRLAPDARRFDVSPPWFSFAAAVPTLEMFAELGVDAIGSHSIGLADELRAMIGLPAGDSAIVSVASDRGPELQQAGIAHASRAGRIRLSFYVYNTLDDVDRAATALGF